MSYFSPVTNEEIPEGLGASASFSLSTYPSSAPATPTAASTTEQWSFFADQVQDYPGFATALSPDAMASVQQSARDAGMAAAQMAAGAAAQQAAAGAALKAAADAKAAADRQAAIAASAGSSSAQAAAAGAANALAMGAQRQALAAQAAAASAAQAQAAATAAAQKAMIADGVSRSLTAQSATPNHKLIWIAGGLGVVLVAGGIYLATRKKAA